MTKTQSTIESQVHEDPHDLLLAAELQAALLPKSCPMNCEHQITSARNRMCGSVGGDFYDFIHINDDQVALIIGDVVGHGIRASLLMANIMGWLRSEPSKRNKPTDVIAMLNRQLIDLGNRTGTIMPCSVFYAVIDQPSGLGLFVNAGHPLPFLCTDNRCYNLHADSHNLLLGVEEFEPQEDCNVFTPGQRLVLYTDGITDTVNPHGERFGMERLGEIINKGQNLSPDELTQKVFDEVDRFRDGVPQIDDETIVVFDRI
jgi:sigma-B regulation protein RsbU (phosphoserine phosphatase)